MDNKEIAHIFNEISFFLEIKGENPFKSRAYQQASKIIEGLEAPVNTLLEDLKEGKVKGIGSGLSEKIEELIITGKMVYYEELKSSFPQGLIEMSNIPGLGPKKIKVIYEELHIDSIGELEKACLANRIALLDGFGKKSQDNILAGIAHIKKFTGQHLYSEAFKSASAIYVELKSLKIIQKISIAGSLRRKKEVVKDIDIVASSNEPMPVMNYFVSLPEVETVIAKGNTKSSVILHNGIQADLRIVNQDEFPFALHHFSGSKEHNILMRSRALKMDLKMNEYGIFRDEIRINCSNEEEIFKVLELAYIPPELREGMEEIEAAERNEIPHLIEERDIKGILHVHSNYSDGVQKIEELARATQKMGYSYLGICDHSQSAAYAGGLKPEAVKRQHEEIDRINMNFKGFKILKGIESDILSDGSLDYPEAILQTFDFVVISIHSKLQMDEESMTRRIITAMQNPYTTILGHPTGRLLLSRDGYPIDMKKIIDCAKKNNVVIELNAHPQRLDIDWRHLKYAKEQGVWISINPDAHTIEGLKDIEYGVGIARKGWLTSENILNALPVDALLKIFRRKKDGN